MLKEADNLPSKVFYDEYRVRILYSKEHKKFVVLFGEIHIKNEAAAEIGKKVVERFDLIGYEMVPKKETDKASMGFNSMMGFAKGVLKICTDKDCRSTILEALERGTNINSEGQVFNKKEMVLDTCSSFNLKTIKQMCDTACLLENIVNINIERNYYIEPEKKGLLGIFTKDYALRQRDIRMAYNIDEILDLFNNDKLLVVLGSGHIDGVQNLLIKEYGLESCYTSPTEPMNMEPDSVSENELHNPQSKAAAYL